MNKVTFWRQIDAEGIVSNSGIIILPDDRRAVTDLTLDRTSVDRSPGTFILAHGAPRSSRAETLYFLLWCTLVREVLLR